MTESGAVQTTLIQARLIVAALVGGVLVMVALSGFLVMEGNLGFLALPAGLLGLVCPVLGYKLYTSRRNAMLSGDWTALTGVLTHVLLAGAIWPSSDRLQPFLGTASAGYSG